MCGSPGESFNAVSVTPRQGQGGGNVEIVTAVNWRLKNLAFRVMETTPAFDGVYRFGRRLMSRRYIPQVNERSLKSYMIPVDVFRAIPDAEVAFEFGAGRGLITPLLLSLAGAKRVIACDLQRLASIEQVNAVISQLAMLGHGSGNQIKSFDDLERRYKVYYDAPGDARKTGLPDGSVDLIYSTATLEHIPVSQIRQILAEARRILKPDGRISFTIDYHDHFARGDPSIGYLNFYQFGDKEWGRYNSDLHYQNRLRHSDFVSLFTEEGFQIFQQTPVFDEWSERDLNRVTLHPQFRHYSHVDLTASNGIFVLGKN